MGPMRFINVFKDGSYIGHKNSTDAYYDAHAHEDELLVTIDVAKATKGMLGYNSQEENHDKTNG